MKAGTRDGKEIIGKKFNLQHVAAPEFVLLEKRIAVFAASHVDARAQCMKAGTRDGKEIIGKKFNLQHGV